ncbi:Acetyl xylan esterase (AXE1) [Gimesia alba]|uniref:Acetyl xylan esterase (AXE1) n=2 Tax=Gimesia alba TaxID=2527973 RepID=A0A517RE06_9PLAN|nr:Acetyl xylan esterase (AXE1) [Gimesia alba]
MFQNDDQFSMDRRSALQNIGLALLSAGVFQGASRAGNVFAAEEIPAFDDSRLGELKDLNGYFPFMPSESPEAWEERAEYVRRQIKVAAGVWPEPENTKINATVHGKVDRDDYTVEKVFFESSPGLFVTGNLYRPKGKQGPFPMVLSPHGHFAEGRFYDSGEQRVKADIKAGAEKYEIGGRYPLQARCVQLARMGCMVFHYDMLGYADGFCLSYDLIHRFSKQRPEMSSEKNWGLFSAQSELRLINALGLQTLNSIRTLDWVSSLSEVDPQRIGITGASGGGTQTFILAAIDNRITAVFPAVMVSTAMQGGCTCENATYLRVDTGNIEFAALVAPRPLGMTAANDWTKEIETKGLPELKQHFKMMGVPENVVGKYYPFPHNYNYVSRAMMYEFFNQHFKLGIKTPIIEADFEPLTREELSVWNKKYPGPPSDEQSEIKILHTLARNNAKQIQGLTPHDQKSLAEYRRVVGGAFEVLVGRPLPAADDLEAEQISEEEKQGFRQYSTLIKNKRYGEATPALFLLPDQWNQKVVIWLDDKGKAGLLKQDGSLTAPIQRLVDAGTAVAGLDVLYQGDFNQKQPAPTEMPVVKNPREFAGYTLGYNHPVFSKQIHDILNVLSFAKHHESNPQSISLAGFGFSGVRAAAACAHSPELISRLAVDTGGFRFAEITNIRDLRLWPGAVKYGDVTGLLSLCEPAALWLAGSSATVPKLVQASYNSAGLLNKVEMFHESANRENAAVDWLLKG